MMVKPSYGREYYLANREKLIQDSKNYTASRYELVNAAKSKPCMDCGKTYPPFVMDLDHRPGEIKLKCVADLTHRHAPVAVIQKEIAKCDVVCSNCHRLRTWKRKQKQCL